MIPSRAAAPSSTHGRKSAARSAGNAKARFARSPLGSITSAGTPSIAASSSSDTPRPVFPLPVIPMITACVTKSFASTSSGSPDGCFAAAPYTPPR